MKHLIIISLIITLAGLSQADYHYASHEGSNEYPYTSWETAADSIQNAVEAASPHDTVYIGTGEFNQIIRVPNETTNLGLIGRGRDSTKIWFDCPVGQNMVWTVDSAFVSDISFENTGVTACLMAAGYLAIKDCYFTGNEAWGIVGYTQSAIVENCIFDNLGENAVSYIFGVSPFIIIRNCLIINCRGSIFLLSGYKVIVENCIGYSALSAMFVQGGHIDTLIIQNNLTHNCNWAYLTKIPQDSSVFNNNLSFEDGSYWEPAFYIYDTYSGKMYNNSITNDFTGIWLRDANEDSWFDLRYNNLKCDVENIQVAFDVVDTSVIYHAFPMYVDPGSRDFHLQAYSKLIDAGHPEILDVDGTRSDIGAYGGPGGTSYHYQDLPPLIPDSIACDITYDSLIFNWHMNEETDFSRYLIYRDTVSGFEPSIFNLIAEPETSYFVDTDFIHQQANYYRLTSVDNQDNQSDYSPEIEVIPTGVDEFGGADLPMITTISNNYPNPFNSATAIVYHVANLGPVPARIDIEIYDILGRKVKTLVSERINPGTHQVTWDGRSDQGEEVQSGVYFARISQWGVSLMNKPRKIVLIK